MQAGLSNRWRIVTVAILGLAPTLASCGATTPNYILKPSAARAIAEHYNLENAIANKTLSQTLDSANEAGLSAEIDNASYQAAQLTGQKGTGTGKPVAWHFTTYVFNQASYPAYFLASAVLPKATEANFFLFVKSSRLSPWKVLYEPYGPIDLLPQLVPAGQGYYAAGPVGKTVVSASTALADLANEWEYYATAVPTDRLFTSGSFTSGNVARIAATAAGWEKSGHGATFSFTASPDSAPILIFRAKNGALVFGGIDTVDGFDVGSNYQTTQSSSRKYFSPFLAPGVYTSVAVDFVDEVMMYIPAKGKVTVVGSYSGNVGASGT